MKLYPIGQIESGQDGAIWGGYLFRFSTHGLCSVYRLQDCPQVAEAAWPAIAAFLLDKAEVLMPHSNSTMFGKEYFCRGDEFPLLYSNIYNSYAGAADPMKGVTCVYRIWREGSAFRSALVQIIQAGFVEDSLWRSGSQPDIRPYGNFVIDREQDRYYAFTMRDADSTTRYFAFPLPRLCDGAFDEAYGVNRVVLRAEDILAQFDCAYHRFVQGAVCHGGRIYSLEGFTDSKENPPAIRIVDPRAQALVETHLFAEFGLRVEPEMIDFDGDTCYYGDSHGNVYRLAL